MFQHPIIFNVVICLFFSKNEISEIFVKLLSKISNFSKFDINEKSLIFLHLCKFNRLICLFFSKNEISDTFLF